MKLPNDVNDDLPVVVSRMVMVYPTSFSRLEHGDSQVTRFPSTPTFLGTAVILYSVLEIMIKLIITTITILMLLMTSMIIIMILIITNNQKTIIMILVLSPINWTEPTTF